LIQNFIEPPCDPAGLIAQFTPRRLDSLHDQDNRGDEPCQEVANSGYPVSYLVPDVKGYRSDM